MANIYDGCVSNYEMLTSISFKNLYKQMDKRLENKKPNQQIVFVGESGGVISVARVVVYNGKIPDIMKNYKRQYLKTDSGWVRGGLLGKCDKCGCVKELVSLSECGRLCGKCTKFQCFMEFF